MASTKKKEPAKATANTGPSTRSQGSAPTNTRVSASGAVAKPYVAAPSAPATAESRSVLKKGDVEGASEFNLLEQPLVSIFVGTPGEMIEVNVHENLLTKHSPFFRAALEPGCFVEGQDGVVYLPEADPAIFSHVVEWIYQQKVGTEEEGNIFEVFLGRRLAKDPEVREFNHNDEENDTLHDKLDSYKKEVREQLTARALTYIGVWKVADFLSMPKLANYIMRRLVNEYSPEKLLRDFSFLPLVSVCYAHEGPLRKWILRLFASGLTGIRDGGVSWEESGDHLDDSPTFLRACLWAQKVWRARAEELRYKGTAIIIQSEEHLMLKEF